MPASGRGGRTAAWMKVKAVMGAANIAEGVHRTPKGLRHAYAINALDKGVPLNMVVQVDGTRLDGNHCHLRQCRGRGTARNRPPECGRRTEGCGSCQ